MNRLTLLAGVPLVVLVPLAAASCANTEQGIETPPAPSNTPEGGAPSADAACDASDENCMSQPVSCDEAPWCPSPTGIESFFGLTRIWGSSKDDVWAVGSGGIVVHWDGASWTRVPIPPIGPLDFHNTFFAIWGRGPKDVWIASTTQTIFRNTGEGWVRQPPPIEKRLGEMPIYAIWGDETGRVRVGTQPFDYFDLTPPLSGNEFVTDGSEPLTWEAGNVTGGEYAETTVFGYFGAPDDLWAITDATPPNRSPWEPKQRGLTVHGVRSGAAMTWTDVDSHALAKLHAIWGSSNDDIWAVGDQGVLRRMRKGQTSWEVVPPVTKDCLYAVWGTSATDVWAAGENGTILHFDGAEWKPSAAAFPAGKPKPHLKSIWGSGPDDVWIVGGQAALHYTGGAK